MSGIASIIFGVVGWWISKLLFEPFKEIVDLRREAQEYLIFYGNLSKDAPNDERRIASDAFRKVGAGLLARYLAAYPWVNWWCERVKWDIHSAGPLLIGIGNSTRFEGFSFVSLSQEAALVRACLRLKQPATQARHSGRCWNILVPRRLKAQLCALFQSLHLTAHIWG